MRWFRVYDEIIDDPKILQLSFELRWYFLGILAISSRQHHRGTLPNLGEIAIHLRVTRGKVNRIVKALVDSGFIDANQDGTSLKVHGWEERQFKSDDVTIRTSAAKERAKERSQERPEEHDGNVPRARASETETETETENTPLKPPKGGKLVSSFELPEWVPRKDWDDFIDMRKRQRKNPTDRARELLVAKLDDLRAKGNDPAKVLQRSIERNWQGLFPLEDESAKPKTNGYHKPDPGAPKSTLGKIQRPNLPRTEEFADIHAMWDRTEANLKRDREIEELDRQRGIRS